MANLTKDRTNFVTKGVGKIQSYPMSAAKIFKGSLVMIVAGFAAKGADTAGAKVVGIAMETVDNTAGAAGDLSIKVEADIIVEMNASSIAAANVGAKMFVVDDNTVDETSPANNVVVGTLIEFVSATNGLVYIPPFAMATAL